MYTDAFVIFTGFGKLKTIQTAWSEKMGSDKIGREKEGE